MTIDPNDLKTWPTTPPERDGYYFYYHEDYPVPDIVWVLPDLTNKTGRGWLGRMMTQPFACDHRTHFYPMRLDPSALAKLETA